MRKRKNAFYGMMCLIWIALILIFALQGGQGSHSLSTSVTRMLAKILIPDFDSWRSDAQSSWISGMEDLVRKCAHFIEFTVLGLLAFPMAGTLVNARRKRTDAALKSALLAFCVCAVIAAASELVQIIAVNRTAGTADVVLDCLGVGLGIFIASRRMTGRAADREAEAPAAEKHRKG